MFVFVCQNGVSCSHYFHKRKLQIYTEEVYRELQQQKNKNDTVKSLTNQIVDNIFHFMLQFNLKFKCVKYKSRKLVSSVNYSPTFPFLYILSFGLATILLYCFPSISSFSGVAKIIPGNSLHPFLFAPKEGGKRTSASVFIWVTYGQVYFSNIENFIYWRHKFLIWGLKGNSV